MLLASRWETKRDSAAGKSVGTFGPGQCRTKEPRKLSLSLHCELEMECVGLCKPSLLLATAPTPGLSSPLWERKRGQMQVFVKSLLHTKITNIINSFTSYKNPT